MCSIIQRVIVACITPRFYKYILWEKEENKIASEVTLAQLLKRHHRKKIREDAVKKPKQNKITTGTRK
ncbi:hypothetical protein C922_05743 [Plasmodium inui San Antonio 1]|uniref:Uncharacterized protein n=1 Tax=Plasmodium inui San Antonio 1 TaxID=1237626 RepID=W6ZX45_9APIC|nr:hypothetical protein C922_05743 [Plasmodium inui San Antonio 1]EUD63878.1 hypothetical protein C922_05743 [Plasmodium inui San Antonio 1]